MRPLILLVALLYACPVDAANLYVNNSGSPSCSDATAKASNSEASPWCTIERARKGATFGSGADSAQAASAGDTVHITCGVYEATASDTAFYVALNPVNEGSSGNPIRFQAVNNQAACIRITVRSGTGPGGSPIGSVDNDYIEWAGFTLNETDWPWDDTGGCCAFQNGQVLFHGTGAAIVGGKIELSTLTGSFIDGRDGDNYTGIRIHSASATIQNNTVQDFGQGGHNNSCTTWYFGVSMVVRHNVFSRCGAGIYAKNNSGLSAGTSQHIIEFNYFAPNTVGIYCLQNCNGTALLPILIDRNVFVMTSSLCATDACHAVILVGLGDAQDPSHVHVVNNTIYGPNENGEAACFRVGPQQAAVAHKIYNNICSTAIQGVIADGGADAGDIATTIILFEHQVWYSISGTLAAWSGIGNINLATWKATYAQDNTSPAAITTDPVFVAAGTDFRLCTGAGAPSVSCAGASNALTQGRVLDSIGGSDGSTIPAGAYLTNLECIGLEASCAASSTGPIRIRRVGV